MWELLGCELDILQINTCGCSTAKLLFYSLCHSVYVAKCECLLRRDYTFILDTCLSLSISLSPDGFGWLKSTTALECRFGVNGEWLWRAHTHTHLSKCVPYIFLAYGINFLTSITRSFKMIFAVRYLEHCTLVRFRLDSIRFDSIWLRAQQQGECGEISTMANAILLLLILFSIIGVCYWCCCSSKSVTFNNNRSTVHKTWYERNTYAVRSSFNSQVTNILMV